MASVSISAPGSAPATRVTGTATPVEVSFCTLAYASTPASAVRNAAEPGSPLCTVGAPRKGASATALTNFAPNSPKVANCARSRTSPNVATSQNAVVPPLPMITSYPSGTEKNSAMPRRRRATSFFTVFCRWEVPRSVVETRDSASTASGRTLLGPQPKRPSAGLISSGIRMLVASATVIGGPSGWAGARGSVADAHLSTGPGPRGARSRRST